MTSGLGGALLAYYYLLPHSLKLRFAVPFGDTLVYLPELGFLLIPAAQLSVRRRGMAVWALIGLAVGLLSATACADPALDRALSTVGELYVPYLVASTIAWTRLQVRTWRVVLTSVLAVLVFEVGSFAAGFVPTTLAIPEIVGGFARMSTTAGAATLTGTVIFLMSMWCIDLWKGNLVVRALILGSSVFAMLCTLSRGPAIMTVGALACWGGVAAWRGRRARARIRPVLAVLVVAAVVGGAVLLGLESVGATQALASRFADSSESDAVRRDRFARAEEGIRSHPVLGVGPGNHHASPRFSLSSTALAAQQTSPHNTYLLIWVEQGALGLLVFFAGALYAGVAAIRQRPVPVSAFALLAVMALGMNTEVVYAQSVVSVLGSLMVAWILGAARDGAT